jgi:hypothetical protein
LTAQAKIDGAGITGVNLKKNLSGQFDVSSTNLNLSVVNIRNPMLKTLINVVAMVPELAKNPESAVGSLVSGITGAHAAGSGGLADDLQKSPVDSVIVRGSAGNGQVQLQQAVVQSPAFRADATGTVTLDDVLTNSAIQIPVSVSLSRSVAQRINLLPANTPNDATFAKLPDFLTMKGTVGTPKADINKLALAGTALKSITSVIPSGTKTGNLLQGIGGLVGGGNTTSTNAPAGGQTNQQGTNQSPVNSLLNQFLKPKK